MSTLLKVYVLLVTTVLIVQNTVEGCVITDVDLMFVVDGSGSVGREGFCKVKNWIKSLVADLDISDQIQVGVVQYSHYVPRFPGKQPYITTEISLQNFDNPEDFNKKVNKIRYHGYLTFTAHAINKTVKEDFMGLKSRYPAARRVMILFTDGLATDASQLAGASRFATANEVESFAVGVVGRGVPRETFLPHLAEIAGSEDRVFAVDSFDDLKTTNLNLQREIAGDGCSDI